MPPARNQCSCLARLGAKSCAPGAVELTGQEWAGFATNESACVLCAALKGPVPKLRRVRMSSCNQTVTCVPTSHSEPLRRIRVACGRRGAREDDDRQDRQRATSARVGGRGRPNGRQARHPFGNGARRRRAARRRRGVGEGLSPGVYGTKGKGRPGRVVPLLATLLNP